MKCLKDHSTLFSNGTFLTSLLSQKKNARKKIMFYQQLFQKITSYLLLIDFFLT